MVAGGAGGGAAKAFAHHLKLDLSAMAMEHAAEQSFEEAGRGAAARPTATISRLFLLELTGGWASATTGILTAARSSRRAFSIKPSGIDAAPVTERERYHSRRC